MKKILIFDGEPEEAGIYYELLRGSGFDATVVDDTLQAWSSLTAPPDLIFTTLIVQQPKALDMIRDLRASPVTASVPIVMFAHSGEKNDLEKNPDFANVHFMIRGFESPGEVLNKVKQILGSSAGPAKTETAEDERTGSAAL